MQLLWKGEPPLEGLPQESHRREERSQHPDARSEGESEGESQRKSDCCADRQAACLRPMPHMQKDESSSPEKCYFKKKGEIVDGEPVLTGGSSASAALSSEAEIGALLTKVLSSKLKEKV